MKKKKIIADLQAELESDQKNFVASKLLRPRPVERPSSVEKVAEIARPIVQSVPKKSGGNMAPVKRKPQAKKAKSRKRMKLRNEKPAGPSPLLKFGFKKKQ